MREYLPLAFVAVALLLSLLAYDTLPDQVPSHWNSRGEVDVTIAAVAGMTIFVIGYSYVAWRQEGGRGY